MKSILYSLVLLLTIASCSKISNSKDITAAQDYNSFLNTENKTVDLINKEYAFWSQKLEKTPNQFPYLGKMAGLNGSKFETTGDISKLIEAEKNYLILNKKTNYDNASYLRGLARNYISQHKFRNALELLLKAEENGEKLTDTQKMLFDVYLELGDDEKAKFYLEKLINLNSFDFLIRTAKWNDHKGNLDAAIKYMEQAVVKAETSKNEGLMQWSYTNLADFYGHIGEIQKSYNYYLKALQLDPNDAYSKKGIAWIVYSYERNPEEAMRILNTVTKNYNTPDFYLLKAEISEYMKDDVAKDNYLEAYNQAVKNENYGDMYNAYNVQLWADNNTNLDAALAVSKREIANRPTPLSYDLLAWSEFRKGNFDKALDIVEAYVVNKTFEPNALYHIAEIYKANQMLDKVKSLKKELKDSAYELGPLMEIKINQL
ncbi:cell surface protein [Bizionia gelidisalsuginis]|uniref:Cell surface protein n=1 Tax=Bizionia gelidisalsuginis TaxID=291188 RepID=A0ABY3ME41_9FLAO|nr:cell surface protein [Bizionia gelidisalsuginis]TYC17858.1 cell surface protein [Bizionia gelidisalsuginis]